MTSTPIALLFADCDHTLTTFPAVEAYAAAEEYLGDYFVELQDGALLAQFAQILAGNEAACDAVTHSFCNWVSSDGIPGEIHWSRYAAFMAMLNMLVGPPVTDWGKLTRIELSLAAEMRFWEVVAQRSARYADADTLIIAAARNGALLQPVSSSDMRCHTVVKSLRVADYDADASTRLKSERIDTTLAAGGMNVLPACIFEQHAKTSREGWERYVVPHGYTHDQIAKAAIVGDSLDDMRAGLVMRMRVRILIDREGKYTDCPDPATHLVRSLSEVPPILGWHS